jgi:hypothetical protein
MSAWRICPRCGGDGKSSAYLGAFSAEEMAEQGEEFQADYFAGRLDRQCESCGGSGKLSTADETRRSQRRAELYLEWLESGRPEGSFSAWSGL